MRIWPPGKHIGLKGKKVSQIAETLKRNPHTVRDWLKRYNAAGLKGLNCKYSPGRSDEKRANLKAYIQEIIDDSPVEHGYKDYAWSVLLIVYDAATKLNPSVSKDTVIRALEKLELILRLRIGGWFPGRIEC